jgi:hypothetical protein
VRGERIKVQVEPITRADGDATGGQNVADRVHDSMRHGLGARPQLNGWDEFRLGVERHPDPQILGLVAQGRIQLVELEMAEGRFWKKW